MQVLDINDRDLNLKQHYLVEASAGTGKTYSIEHFVTRLLMEGEDTLTIDQILVITFTRQATKELSRRIHQLLEKIHDQLALPVDVERDPDFLQAVKEKGDAVVEAARKALRTALYDFDNAAIMTIHGFSLHHLKEFIFEGDLSFDLSLNEEAFSSHHLIPFVTDFLRSDYLHAFGLSQINILIKHYGDIDRLIHVISEHLLKETSIPQLKDYTVLYQDFCHAVTLLQAQFGITGSSLQEDILKLAVCFKECLNREKTINKNYREEFETFIAIFNKQEIAIEDFEHLLSLESVSKECAANNLFSKFTASNLQKKFVEKYETIQAELHCPELVMLFNKHIQPILSEATDPISLLLRMIKGCRSMLRQYIEKMDLMTPDGFLKRFLTICDQPSIVEKIQSDYQAAIVDEFQDTDSVQWEIISKLFLNKQKTLMLVGDPKQAIYGFRNADIYTYIDAQLKLGKEHLYCLNTNYRAHTELIEGLNGLFDPKKIPFFMALPKLKDHLQVIPVASGNTIDKKEFQDTLAGIHFFLVKDKFDSRGKWPNVPLEEEYLFPFIAQEIKRLHDKDAVSYQDMAVLIRDRYQAERLEVFFKKVAIPSKKQHGGDLRTDSIICSMKELCMAVLTPTDRSKLKVFLGGHLFRWSYHQIEQLTDELIASLVIQLTQLRLKWFTDGFAGFFETLLHSSFCKEDSVEARILNEQNGAVCLTQLWQLASIMIEEETQKKISPHKLLEWLQELEILTPKEDPRLLLWSNEDDDAVNILTLHVAKGLEFDIVFPIGLASRHTIKHEMITVNHADAKAWASPMTDSRQTELYYQEKDAEKMRLLYVAMTRAKQRLYLPVLIDEASTGLKRGSASPIELFLAQWKRGHNVDALYEWVTGFSQEDFMEIFHALKNYDVSMTLLDQPVSCVQTFQDVLNPVLEKKITPLLTFQQLFLHSFSSLSKDKKRERKNEYKVPLDFESSEKNPFTLPAGAFTGTLVHTILERIDFEVLSEKKGLQLLLEALLPLVETNQFQAWQDVLAEIINNLFNSTLQSDYHPIQLKEINPLHMYREQEFYFLYDKDLYIEGIQYENGFLHGLIDLIFAYDGYYYIIDYKTNWLGPAIEDYNQEKMHLSMDENDYFLQAKIYKKALKNYLALVEKKSFKECFGGVFYLFLRGLNKDNDYGVFYLK